MNRPLIVWYLYDKFILFSFDRAMFVESFWTSEQIPPETPTEAISEQQPQQPCGVWLVLVCVCVCSFSCSVRCLCASVPFHMNPINRVCGPFQESREVKQ